MEGNRIQRRPFSERSRPLHKNRDLDTFKEIRGIAWITIDGVRHYLGRKFKGKEIRVEKIGDGRAAVIERGEDGEQVPTHVFHLSERGDPGLKQRTGEFYDAPASVVALQPITPQDAAVVQSKMAEKPEASIEVEKRDMLYWFTEKGIFGSQGGRATFDDVQARNLNMLNQLHRYIDQARENGQLQKLFPEKPTTAEVFLKVFAGVEAVPAAEAKNTDAEPRKILYAPQTVAEAFDREYIRDQQFILEPWRLADFSKGQKHLQRYPSLNEGENLNMAEVALACITYNNQLGAGYRDSEDNLYVYNPETNEYQAATSDYYTKTMRFREPAQQASMYSPRVYLDLVAPRLRDSGLLRKEDFEMVSGSPAASRERMIRKPGIGRSGIMFDGVRHYLGAQFVGRDDVRVHKISLTLGGITQNIDGKEQLTHVFDIVGKDRATYRESSRFYDAGAQQTRLREYNPDEFQGNEGNVFRNYNGVIELSERLTKEAGLNLSSLSFESQLWATHAVEYIQKNESFSQDDFVRFARTFGLDGVQAFFSAAYGTDMAEKVLQLSQEQQFAQQVFYEYARLIQLVDKALSQLEIDDTDALREAVLRQGKELIVAGAFVGDAKAQGASIAVGENDIVRTMQSYYEYIAQKMGLHSPQGEPLDPLPDLTGHQELQGMLQAHFTAEWHARRSQQETDVDIQEVVDRTLDFYTTYEEMNREAATMNADTAKELQRLSSVLERMPDGAHILDAGCGDMSRITTPLAEQFPQLQFTGVDIRDITPPSEANMRFQKDDITRLKNTPENSQAMIMMNWSVANDILGVEDQRRMWNRFAEVLQPNGVVVIDIPYLEGGEGSYQQMVERTYSESQSAQQQLPYGTVVLRLPREEGGELLKRVHIFQLQELTTQLQEAGFRVANPVTAQANIEAYRAGESPDADSAFTTPAWRTTSGKARITIIAQKAA